MRFTIPWKWGQECLFIDMSTKIGFSGYRPVLRLAGLLWIVLLFLFLIVLISAIKMANQAAELTATPNNSGISILLNKDLSEINKEINWLEQQLILAKSDSLSLGINLRDSVFQVQLKGIVLFSTRIEFQNPEKFLSNITPSNYYKLFGKSAKIISETANIRKKPVRKVSLKNIADFLPAKDPSPIKDERFHWQFCPDNKINVVINGIKFTQDSAFSLLIMKDIFKYNLKEIFQKSTGNFYCPTLFLWLDDKEVRTVYRALPENAKVVFLN